MLLVSYTVFSMKLIARETIEYQGLIIIHEQ